MSHSFPRVLHHRGSPGRAAGRADDRPGGRREPRERGRPRHRRREGHARGDQLHDHATPAASSAWPMSPAICDRLHLEPQTAVNTTRTGTPFTRQVRRPHRHHHRHLGVRPRPHRPGRHRPARAARRPGRGKGHVDGLRRSRAACWSGPATPRAASTWPGWPASRRRPSSARSSTPDGPMARLPDLREFCQTHGLKMCTIEDLIKYRRTREKLIRRELTVEAADRATATFDLFAYTSWSIPSRTWPCAWAASARGGRATACRCRTEPVLVRIHSQCLTGDMFGSLLCDCGSQLHQAMEQIAPGRQGRGALHAAGGPRHRPAEQAAGVQAAAGGRAGHRRGQPSASASRRTCATTASVRRSCSTWACGRSAC